MVRPVFSKRMLYEGMENINLRKTIVAESKKEDKRRRRKHGGGNFLKDHEFDFYDLVKDNRRRKIKKNGVLTRLKRRFK